VKTKQYHLVNVVVIYSLFYLKKKQPTLYSPILKSQVQTGFLLYHLVSTLGPLVVLLAPVLAPTKVIVAARRAPHWILFLLL
jgi:hypothetical protein